MNIAKLSVLRPVAMAMVIGLLGILGLVSLRDLSIDLFPELTFPIVAVTTSYEGAGPEEIEKLITQPIEEIMSSVPNVESVSSTSRTGGSLVLVAFDWGTDMDFAALTMRERIDMVRDLLPEGVQTPQVLRFDPNMLPILQLAITAPSHSVIEVRKLVENEIKPRLDSVDGVASVQVEGGATEEIQLLADANRLAMYGITLQELQQYIGSENLTMPGGQLLDGNEQIPIRISGEFESVYDLQTFPIPTLSGLITLSDLVEIKETVTPSLQESYLNGEPSVGISILKASGTNTVAVAGGIHDELLLLEEQLPVGFEVVPIFDQSRFIIQSIKAVAWNIVIGSILASFVLYTFLRNLRSTLIIAFSIPISIITTFLFMYGSGQTLNVLTLGGLALGVGMMVDNAIVILENIYRLHHQGVPIKEAAIKGTNEIGGAIIVSTLTTIVVFLPIVFVDGLAAQLFKPLALTVAFSLFASLFTALIIVPLLTSTFLRKNSETSSFQHGFERLLTLYKGLLHHALTKPKRVIITTISLFVLSLVGIPFTGTEFLPAQDQGMVTIDVRLPAGKTIEATTSTVHEIDEKIKRIPEVQSAYVTVGGTDNFTISAGTQTNRATYTLLLHERKNRHRTDVEIAEDIRNKIKHIPGADISVSGSDSSFTGEPISITLHGRDIETLHYFSKEIIELIKGVDGVREPSSNMASGNPEISVKINRNKASQYGIGSMQIASTVNTATRGLVATKLARQGDEINVRLLLDDSTEKTVNALSQLLLDTPSGERIPISAVATLTRDVGPTTIRRSDRLREVTIHASIINRDLGSIVTEIKNTLSDELVPILPAGYSITYGGQDEQMEDAFLKLGGAIALAVLLVYMVLAGRFESFFYPLLIMFSVPITLIGIIFGLLVTFQPIGVGSLIGILILTGIVVNNAIVLIDYINTLKARGMTSFEAIIEAGPTRLRPILMTALTTILGLIPLTLGFGEGTEIQQPMAIVIVFGLAVSTLITLFFIPTLYYLFDKRKEKKAMKNMVT
ncbi:efflux RND transporter permease subunit [Alkalihalobacillus sp. LMS39]|uniref:efflux RND transporter permease subunit n=1 Tax=Alkalihalobacillus sp. LMS39 TaxID=2924032 RepID=UPI001FB1ED81|nr:efflux RND transporter permease subunit [Alkalihalobacillus sp. LMS39]UOE93153.1 efflux RND transporter permease subunit [Alkalihalobacillus sp. LMS39]